MNPISAVKVAEKFHAARNGHANNFADQLAGEPRVAELLWAIQAASLQPGGLETYVADLVKHHPQSFQTHAMIEAGKPDDSGHYSPAQCIQVWKAELRHDGFNLEYSRDPEESIILESINLDRISFHDFLTIFVSDKTTLPSPGDNSVVARALRKGFERFNFAYMNSECLELTRNLPSRLADVCTLPHLRLSPASFCPSLPDLLIADLDRRAREVAAQIAETEVARTVRRELEFAISEGVPVPFIGDSRFGKTKAIANYCAMHPGRARLVTVPNNTNSEMAFMRAHADAFGIEYTGGIQLSVLRDAVEFVIRNSGLAVIYDEAHALVPIGYTKTSAPRRLNWVRSSVIDQGVPCAFFATPQSKMDTLEQYARTTGYNLSQWVGRMAPPVILSDVIPLEDIIAVARTQFPELTQAHLEEMADRAILSDGYLKNIEMAGRRARFLARERGHAKPTTQDVLDACDDMMSAAPRIVTDSQPVPKRTPAKAPRATTPASALQPRGSRPATPALDASAPEFPRRSTTPARLINEPVTAS